MGRNVTPGPMFATGDVVEITAGMSKATRGVVVSPTRYRYGEEPVFDVRLESGYTRPIRETFLRLLKPAVPKATESDDDVMSPLRRVTCP